MGNKINEIVLGQNDSNHHYFYDANVKISKENEPFLKHGVILFFISLFLECPVGFLYYHSDKIRFG